MANDGIHKMKGYNDPNFQNAVSINEQDTSLLGQQIGSHDLVGKKRKLEEISSYNFFSSMGKKMSDGITQASEKIIQSITK